MAKNLLIFCDGTGQVGGVHFDEVRTNVYKMYRTMRCGPDSTIDPARRVAFYDPGIGSSVDGGGLVGGAMRGIYNVIAQATGFGITRNVVDCYAPSISASASDALSRRGTGAYAPCATRLQMDYCLTATRHKTVTSTLA